MLESCKHKDEANPDRFVPDEEIDQRTMDIENGTYHNQSGMSDHFSDSKIGTPVKTATKKPCVAVCAVSHQRQSNVTSMPGHFSTAILSPAKGNPRKNGPKKEGSKGLWGDQQVPMGLST